MNEQTCLIALRMMCWTLVYVVQSVLVCLLIPYGPAQYVEFFHLTY